MPRPSPFLETELANTRDLSGPSDPTEALRLISHQLRQPLSTIQAIAYFLSMTLPESETRVHEQVVKLQKLVEDADGILSDALHLFQVSQLRLSPVGFDDFVAETLADLRDEANWEIRFEPGAGSASATLDAIQATRAARNSLYYLRQVSMPGATIEVETWAGASETALAMRVENSVSGPEEADVLLDSRHPRLGSGSGLAMATVRRIVDAHEGHIVARPWQANGVELVVFFPRAD